MEFSWKEKNSDLELYLDCELWKCVSKKEFRPHLDRLKKCSSVQELQELFDEIEKKLSFSKAADLLARRALSSAMLSQKLSQKGFSKPAIDHAIKRLQSLQLIDDAYIAEMLGKKYGKKYGDLRFRLEMKNKGVALPMIESLLKELPDEQARILDHLPSEIPSDKKQKAKLFRSLARLGFSPDVIFSAINRE